MKTVQIILTSAALLLSTANSFASTNKEVYSLKGEATTGSRIPVSLATSNIPFNKAYDELSKSQQEQVNAKFDNLGLNDTPPFPLKGLKSVYKPLVNANKSFKTNAPIKASITVGQNGYVSNVEVLNTMNPNFAKQVEKALSRVEFKPATCDGAKCEMNFPVNISFH